MFKDSRGRNISDLFPDIQQGQINLSHSYPGTIRAFHRHKKQWDFWYLVAGDIEVALYNEESKELRLEYLSGNDDTVLEIEPMLWHGFKVLGQKEATLLYYVTRQYDPDNPDEERAPYDKFHDWLTPKK